MFADTGKARYVKICKAGGTKLSECGTSNRFLVGGADAVQG